MGNAKNTTDCFVCGIFSAGGFAEHLSNSQQHVKNDSVTASFSKIDS
jgi:hypothetical protein